MKKIILIVTSLTIINSANAQFGKMLKNMEDNANGKASDKLPKGVEIYNTTHTDSINLSGKYYTKFPVTMSIKNAMNIPKYFSMSELTIEYRHTNYTGLFHFIKDEPSKQMRSKTTDMNTAFDFALSGMNGVEIPKRNMKACNCFQLEIDNKFENGEQKIGFKDGARLYRYTKDPEILFIGDPSVSSAKKGPKEFFMDNGHRSLGGNFNMLCKNKEKLEQWDSIKIAEAIFEMELLYQDSYNSSFAASVELPKKGVSDAAREKEYFNLIKPFADKDKPANWGDKFVFCYIQKDWKVIYKKDNPTAISHRNATVIAVSTGWPKGECRYITCAINQSFDGKDFGKAFMAGFVGSLVPVSCESVNGFNK
ncbi:MAG: hypothetical protein SFY56_04070 [Bacteroidota bacterium]|nr:hypothetical protein [Bacteroidota bacterium]